MTGARLSRGWFMALTAAGAALAVAAALVGAATPASAAPWQNPPSFAQCNATHNWQAFGSPFQAPQFRSDSGGFVHLRGALKCATAANLVTMFTLPGTSDPFQPEDFPVATGDGAGNYDDYSWVHVATTGQVERLPQYSGAFVSVSGVEFANAKWKKPPLRSCTTGSDWTSDSVSKVGYVLDADGVVHLRGRISCPDTADRLTLFTLPAGDRPAKKELFPIITFPAVAAAVVEVDPDGSVIAGGALGNDDLTISGIAFNASGATTTGAWTKPALSNCAFLTSWQKFGSGTQAPAYRKDSHGFVHLRGLAKCGTPATTPTTLFTLPVGLRPPAAEVFPIATGLGPNDFADASVIEVDSDGTVNVGGGYDSRAVSLGAILFDTQP